MTEQQALEIAAKAAGFDDWRQARNCAAPDMRSIIAHANEILARQAVEKELADLRKEVSEAVEEVTQRQGKLQCLLRFIIPAPDPLVEALSEAMCGIPGEDYTQSAEDLRNVLAKYGLKLERIDQ